MAEKKRSAGLPAKFDPDQQYEVFVETPFTLNGRFRVRSGVATLKGTVAEQFRDNIRAVTDADKTRG
jgi:hypothetical protein